MLLAILVYNFVMVGVDVIALQIAGSKRTWLMSVTVAGCHVVSAFILALLICGPSFAAFQLLTFGLFLHFSFGKWMAIH